MLKLLLNFTIFIISPICLGIDLAITIDDLPMIKQLDSPTEELNVSNSIISTLKKFDIPEVYGFLVGKNLKNMPIRETIVKNWVSNNFLLGNHTYFHSNLAQISAADFINDLEKNESILIDYVSTIEELKVFRYPFLSEGENNEKRYEIRSYLKKRSYKIAQVSLDFLDWIFSEAYNRCKSKNNHSSLHEIKVKYLSYAKEMLLFKIKASQLIWGNRSFPLILLLHMSPHTADFLPELLTMFKSENVNFISAKHAIQNKIYDEDTTYVGESGKDFIQQAAETRKIDLSILSPPPSPNKWLESICIQ